MIHEDCQDIIPEIEQSEAEKLKDFLGTLKGKSVDLLAYILRQYEDDEDAYDGVIPYLLENKPEWGHFEQYPY